MFTHVKRRIQRLTGEQCVCACVRVCLPACAHPCMFAWLIMLIIIFVKTKNNHFIFCVCQSVCLCLCRWMPNQVVTDFEMALMVALWAELLALRTLGCFYHFCQSLWWKVQELGLAGQCSFGQRVRQYLICDIDLEDYIKFQ